MANFSCPVLLTLLLAPTAAATPGEGEFTPELVARLRSVTSAVIAPDGARAAYLLSVPRILNVDADGAPWAELHVADLAAGTTRGYVTGKQSLSALAWSSDGRTLTFLAKRGSDKATALYALPVDGGEARRALTLDSAIESYDLGPDGKTVLCIAAPPKDTALDAAREKGFTQEIYEEDGRPSELWLATLDGSAKPVRVPFEGHPREARLSPVDGRLLVAYTPTVLVDDDYMEKRVVVLEGASGKVLGKIENPGKLGKIGWSPDGKNVALIAAADLNDPAAGRLCVAPASGGVPRDLAPGLEADASDFAWQTTDALLAVTAIGCESRLDRYTLAGGAPLTIVPPGGQVLTSISLARDRLASVFTASSPFHPTELFRLKHGEPAPVRVSDSNPELAGLAFARQEVIRHRSRDGLELEGVLIHPLRRAEGARVPLILNVHGGPESHVSNGWLTAYSNPGQVAAARGFAVFHPNYRGSTGRGVAFSKLGQGDPAGKEFDDLIDAVDHLIELGLVDTKKVAVTGGSYGGYATAWCSTRYSERFAAGVMFVGISNKVSKVGTTDIADEEFHVHALERPWDDWQKMLERSPITHAGNCKTPLLILHGKDDPRVSVTQSRELYRHLKLRSQAPVRLVLYPGEGHGNRRAASRFDYALRSLEWFEHYLLGPGGEMPDPTLDYSDKEQAAPVEAGT
jgi:dipeptidyl aminopeptidase/acylaminoacyl peptidase